MEEKWDGRPEEGRINRKRADELMARFDSEEKTDLALEKLKDYWTNLLSRFTVSSDEEKLDRMVNVWHQYQCMVTFNMSRSASYFESGIDAAWESGIPVRICLDLSILFLTGQGRGLIDIASTQFEDGSAYHQYQPLTKKGNSDIGSGFNDDPLWLIAGQPHIKETGDYTILDEATPFDSDTSNTVSFMEHLRPLFPLPSGSPGTSRSAADRAGRLERLPEPELFLHGTGRIFQTFGPSEGPNAESVFIAGMFVLYGKDLYRNLPSSGPERRSRLCRESRKRYGTDRSGRRMGRRMVSESI